MDESLREVVKQRVIGGANIEVSFEAPNKDWAARRNTPTINLYLYDIREDMDRRAAFMAQMRDTSGFVTDRRLPPRVFKLSYLITAWTQRAEDEHRLLSAALFTFLGSDVLPAQYLQGALAQSEASIPITIAQPLGDDKSISDVWTALGGELKPSLDLVASVLVDPNQTMEFGPPVMEEPRIGLRGPDGKLEIAGAGVSAKGDDEAGTDGKRKRGAGAKGARGKAGAGDSDPTPETKLGTEVEDAEGVVWEEIYGEKPGTRGRTMKFRPIPPNYRRR